MTFLTQVPMLLATPGEFRVDPGTQNEVLMGLLNQTPPEIPIDGMVTKETADRVRKSLQLLGLRWAGERMDEARNQRKIITDITTEGGLSLGELWYRPEILGNRIHFRRASS